MIARSFFRFFICCTAIALCSLTFSSCSQKPSQEEISKLDDAKAASETAEKKLNELKQERIRLETELQQKQDDLKKSEEERDNLKKKTGK